MDGFYDMHQPTYNSKRWLKILLADTDYSEFLSLKHVLSVKNGFHADFLWCGERDQYCAAVLSGIYDLVLMDYSVESLFVLEQAISEGCHTPIVMLVDQSSDAQMMRAARCGAMGVLNRKHLELHSLKYFLLCANMHRHSVSGEQGIANQNKAANGLSSFPRNKRSFFQDSVRRH